MNIIKIIFVERLLFDSEVKESLEITFKRSGIKFSYYDEYHETDELFFVDGEKCTLQGIKRYVRNYFISKTSNKPTKDSTKNNTKRPKIGL